VPRHSKPISKQKPLGYAAEVEALLLAGDVNAADALAAMAESGPPETAKAARRALHRLELRGIRPSRQSPNAGNPVPATRDQKHGMEAARMVQSDMRGERAFVLARSDSAGQVIEFVVTPSGTIRKVTRLPIRLDAYVADHPVELDEPLLCAKIPADYARYRVHEAARLTRELNELRPVGLSAALSEIGPCERAYERSLVYEHMHAGTGIVSADDEKAFQREAITIIFAFDPQGVSDFIEASLEVLNSRIVLTDQQRADELNRVLRSTMGRMMPVPVYEEALRRLEDHALLYYLEGATAKARTVLLQAEEGRRADGPASWPLAQFAARIALFRYVSEESEGQEVEMPSIESEDIARAPIIHLPR